jgi:hypothetical protein
MNSLFTNAELHPFQLHLADSDLTKVERVGVTLPTTNYCMETLEQVRNRRTTYFSQSSPEETDKDSAGPKEPFSNQEEVREEVFLETIPTPPLHAHEHRRPDTPTEAIQEGLRNRHNAENPAETFSEIPAETTTEAEPEAAPEEVEVKMCRICFAGDDEPDLGRMISPCKCRGTMKYIHTDCLNAWRTSSARSTSFFQCDQCGYKYRLERTFWANLVMNEMVLSLVTLILFTLLVFFSGFLCKLLIRFWILTEEDWEEMARVDQMKREGKVVVLEDEWGSSMFAMDLRSLSLTTVDTSHFLAGLALVGFFGAMSLMITIFSGPFPRVGGVRIGGRGYARDGNNSGTFLMAIFIVVGAAKTAYSLYKAVKSFSRRSLEVLETAILDVEPEAPPVH